MDNKDVGILIKQNPLLYRQYFKEMVKLVGINVVYRAPRDSKDYDLYGELDTNYYEPIVVGCIFDEHPTQKTMKKLGWASESVEDVVVISVPYDLQKLQRGALFTIPSAYDNTEGRLFKVDELSVEMIYPASITCKLIPVLENEFNKSDLNYSSSNFNLLDVKEDY